MTSTMGLLRATLKRCVHKWVLRMTLHGIYLDNGLPDPRQGEMDAVFVCERCGKKQP